MAKASDNQFPKVTFAESAAPATPAAGLAFVYVKADGKVYLKNDAGTETDLTLGSSGGAPSLLLNYRPAADLSINGGSALTVNTWTDATADQTFTVTNASALVQINVGGSIFATHSVSGNSSQVSARVVIDSAGTPQNIIFAGDGLGGTQPRGNFLAGSAPIYLSGLSAAAHTVKVQVFSNIANTSAFCRPVTINPSVESLNITVLQHAA